MSESNPILYPRAAMDQWLGSGATKSAYNLDEYLKMIEPTYQVYEDYIRKCVIVTTVEKQYKGHPQRKRQREGFFSKSASAKPRNVR